MTRRATMAAIGAALMLAAAASAPLQAAGDLAVAVTYKGKGPVDETREILVFLFDHPVPGPDSLPLALSTVTKNGGTATFKNISAETVYVIMVYDHDSSYDGQSGPPPPGHPIGSFNKAGKPIPVTPAPNAKVTASFDDSRRWGQ